MINMKFLTRKVKVLGKSVPVFALVLILMTGIATAALLTYYGTITGSATVSQSVLLDQKSVPDSLAISYDASGVAGSSDVEGPHFLTNNAPVPTPVKLVTTQCIKDSSDCITEGHKENGITTTYVGELELTEKTVVFGEAPWAIPLDADKVTVKYTIVGNDFKAQVTNPISGYELIYYKDKSDRFNEPASAIRVSNVNKNLPYPSDQNADEYNYCSIGESGAKEYVTCHGAKIWYVPSNAIKEDKTLDWSRASEFYYETELIQYNSDGIITVYPQEILDFSIVNDFNVALVPGTYTITTTVNPQ